MGFMDWLGDNTKPDISVDLRPNEHEQFRTTAVINPGWKAVGGELVLTNQRIIFAPLDLRQAAAMLKVGLKMFDHPTLGVVTKLIDKGIVLIGVQRDIASGGSGISAQAGRNGTLVRTPELILTVDGNDVVFGISSHMWALNISRSNLGARDAAVEQINLWGRLR